MRWRCSGTPPISIHAPRTGSDQLHRRHGLCARISIHAPRTGSDLHHCLLLMALSHFNPRSPHGERHLSSEMLHGDKRFQSTLPARGATYPAILRNFRPYPFQSTLPARGATVVTRGLPLTSAFQSTLPARGATLFQYYQRYLFQFQSTLPARGATKQNPLVGWSKYISIHAPRTGSDNCAPNAAEIRHNFNPRSPHGERRWKCVI